MNKKRWNKTKYKIITKNQIKNHTVKYKKIRWMIYEKNGEKYFIKTI